ncbi:DUF3810 domain-containing protein [Pedobacter metabolipauper]|uniref:Uncharacterized protein DUF3810 n=1 Tax=Pedobacter metabolipauper TaxID=425513 RepID=A0A4R6SU56_9SPHI|nr:DUF3810 domain-containing protein [Pedobacter metabolipauper]TDQ08548.1 uncharacterized protein DUF3810 [Pedobacter metabolipauper]
MKAGYLTRSKWSVFLFVLSLLVYGIGLSSSLTERIYSGAFYTLSSVVQRFISALVPFALGDFLYLLLILFIIRSLFLFYKKIARKTLKRADRINIPLQVINFTLILYLLFKILWGLNYSRPSIALKLGISNEKYTTAELVQLGDLFINKLNNLQRIKKTRYTLLELESKAKDGYDKMKKVNPFFNYDVPAVKAVLNSWVITKIGIEGYYNPLSGEANINMRLPAVALPFVTCHEIAHQLGIGREDEANLIGYLVAINSNDQNFQYSAAYAMLKSILFEIRLKSPDDYAILYKKINAVTLGDFTQDRAFWMKYNNQMFNYLDVAFDRFLKLNNQRKGTDSYQDIVIWLYNIHKKELKKL